MATSTQLQDMDDIALCELAKSPAATGAPVLILLELVRRFEPHAQAPDHQDYPFIAEDTELKGETEEHQNLYSKRDGCDGVPVPANGGGVKCPKCPGWFCY